MKRFEVVQNIPSPYRLHLFREMHRQLNSMGIAFHVNFMSDMSRGHDERPLSWRNPQIDFPHVYWKDYGIGQYHFNPSMIHYLRKNKPDYLLVGSTFDTFTSWAASFLCKTGVRCAWSEGNTKTTGEMGGVRGWIKRTIFSQYPLVGVAGSDCAKYINLHQKRTSRRMPKAIFLPNLIDETRFRPRQNWNVDEIQDIRMRLGAIDDVRICVIPARLEKVKGLIEFISLLTPDMVNGWRIIIMGQGPLRGEIEKIITERRLSNFIKILDFVPYDDMPKVYAASDLFLLPSLCDRNPLSVVEALHSGLPIALSKMAGNVEEAVTPGVNGWALRVDDKTAFAEQLKEMFATPRVKLRNMGEKSYEVNSKFWVTKDAVSKFLNEIISFRREA